MAKRKTTILPRGGEPIEDPKPEPKPATRQATHLSHDGHLVIAPGDAHFVVNAKSEILKAYYVDPTGKRTGMLYSKPARCYGANGPGWQVPGGDTPPGPYLIGEIHHIHPDDKQANAFGPVFMDLEELLEQERKYHRAGVGVHGGGSGLADPWHAARQGWKVTNGCIRMQNEDVLRVLETVQFVRKNGGQAWLTVVW